MWRRYRNLEFCVVAGVHCLLCVLEKMLSDPHIALGRCCCRLPHCLLPQSLCRTLRCQKFLLLLEPICQHVESFFARLQVPGALCGHSGFQFMTNGSGCASTADREVARQFLHDFSQFRVFDSRLGHGLAQRFQIALGNAARLALRGSSPGPALIAATPPSCCTT